MGITKVEKNAWILLLAIGVLALVGAVLLGLGIDQSNQALDTILGMTLSELKDSNPDFFKVFLFYVRFSALSDLGFAFLIIAVSVTAYRRGEKWAWYALWSVPAWFIGSAAISVSVVPPVSVLLPPIMVFAILGLLGQLLSYRKFFGRK